MLYSFFKKKKKKQTNKQTKEVIVEINEKDFLESLSLAKTFHRFHFVYGFIFFSLLSLSPLSLSFFVSRCSQPLLISFPLANRPLFASIYLHFS